MSQSNRAKIYCKSFEAQHKSAQKFYIGSAFTSETELLKLNPYLSKFAIILFAPLFHVKSDAGDFTKLSE